MYSTRLPVSIAFICCGSAPLQSGCSQHFPSQPPRQQTLPQRVCGGRDDRECLAHSDCHILVHASVPSARMTFPHAWSPSRPPGTLSPHTQRATLLPECPRSSSGLLSRTLSPPLPRAPHGPFPLGCQSTPWRPELPEDEGSEPTPSSRMTCLTPPAGSSSCCFQLLTLVWLFSTPLQV